MAGTTARTRKTTAKTTSPETPPSSETTPDLETTADAPLAEEATPTAENETEEPRPAADSTPAPPDAAPLEPPITHEPPSAPAEPGYVTPTEVIPDAANLAEVIIDDATGEPPADVDEVFKPLTEYGSVLVCTVRLVEQTYLGPHSTPVHRLLQPAGASVSESVAARIRERLQAQADRIAAQATEQ
ncbi:hypothetical protein ACFCWY_09045 [Streptomyces sp. NPDC056362]|uniref:hypothetical protein n=1 Tax=unclassified Streptomyces TaxID=2593676 RepID=UPI0035D62FA9